MLLCYLPHPAEVRSEGRVVCYYTNWSVYRPGTAKFNPQNINPYLCTHLVYAFGGFTKDNQMKPFDKYQDIEQGESLGSPSVCFRNSCILCFYFSQVAMPSSLA